MKSSLMRMGVANPQAPRHSTSCTVKRPSGLVRPSSSHPVSCRMDGTWRHRRGREVVEVDGPLAATQVDADAGRVESVRVVHTRVDPGQLAGPQGEAAVAAGVGMLGGRFAQNVLQAKPLHLGRE